MSLRISSAFFFIFISINFCSTKGWLIPSVHKQKVVIKETTEELISDDTIKSGGKDKDQFSDDLEIGKKISIVPQKKKYKKSFLFEKEKDKKNGANTSATVKQKKRKRPKARTKKEKKKYSVSYSGNQFIREIKVHPYNNLKQVVLTIKGKAAIKKDHSTIYAPIIEVLGDDASIAIAGRKIKIRDYKNNTTLTAGYGEYMKYQRTALARKNPKIIHINKKNKRKTIIRSLEMQRFFATAQTHCYGEVVITGEKYIAYADKAIFYEADDRIVLEGDPKIYQKDNIFLAEKMIFYNSLERTELHGNVKLVLTSEDNTDQPSQDEKDKLNDEPQEKYRKVTSIIYANKAKYVYGGRYKNNEETTFYPWVDKQVKIKRTDSVTLAGFVKTRGPAPDFILAKEQVMIIYKKDNTRIYSEKVEYYKKQEKVILSSERNKNKIKVRPQILFVNENYIPTGKLTAEKIVRNLKNEKTQARGEVVIEMYNESKQKDSKKLPLFTLDNNPDLLTLLEFKEASIHGQWAELFDQKKETHVLGAPYLKQNKSIMHARKIILYSEKQQFELLGLLHGHLLN